MAYWLMKSEPSEFSIDDLKSRPKKTEPWDGVRNYQARNFMRSMQIGDLAFFYHSNTNPPGIVGIMQVVKTAYPDHTAFDPQDSHFDPKSDPDNPRWHMVDVKFKQKLARCITLEEIKHNPELANMPLVRKGNRLSIMPVSQQEWQHILEML